MYISTNNFCSVFHQIENLVILSSYDVYNFVLRYVTKFVSLVIVLISYLWICMS